MGRGAGATMSESVCRRTAVRPIRNRAVRACDGPCLFSHAMLVRLLVERPSAAYRQGSVAHVLEVATRSIVLLAVATAENGPPVMTAVSCRWGRGVGCSEPSAKQAAEGSSYRPPACKLDPTNPTLSTLNSCYSYSFHSHRLPQVCTTCQSLLPAGQILPPAAAAAPGALLALAAGSAGGDAVVPRFRTGAAFLQSCA